MPRQVYEAMDDKQCVWSGVPLARAFDVDHIIPFALWRNNDLWNLVPAATRVNNQKRDLLPTRRLLSGRRSVIIDDWQRLADALPHQFETELGHVTGEGGCDYEGGFDALAEAVETTALQRGCERWTPSSPP